MLKPTQFYSQVIAQAKKEFPNMPMFVYQNTHEYGMLHYGAENGLYDLKEMLKENISNLRRLGELDDGRTPSSLN